MTDRVKPDLGSRDGILKHSKPEDNIYGEGWGEVGTLEGEICKISDLIAYVNHDIGDAIRAGIITENDLPSSTFKLLGKSHGERVNTMVCDIIENSWAATGSSDSPTKPVIKMSDSVLEATNELRTFLLKGYIGYNPKNGNLLQPGKSSINCIHILNSILMNYRRNICV